MHFRSLPALSLAYPQLAQVMMIVIPMMLTAFCLEVDDHDGKANSAVIYLKQLCVTHHLFSFTPEFAVYVELVSRCIGVHACVCGRMFL